MMPPAPFAAVPMLDQLICRTGELFERASLPEVRSQRVVLLIVASTMMALADLFFTLTYAVNTGMLEMNPIARAVFALDCPNLVVVWKIALMVIASGFLWVVRHHRSAEIGAWIGVVVLTALMLHWVRYVGYMSNVGTEELYQLAQAMQADHRYVLLDLN